jgi:hypothetical protein
MHFVGRFVTVVTSCAVDAAVVAGDCLWEFVELRSGELGLQAV